MKQRMTIGRMGSLIAAVLISQAAAAQSLEAARAERERAKADLTRAQRVFEQADEAYVKALAVAAGQRSAAPSAPPPLSRPGVVTFTMSGPGALEINPLDYKARLTIDGEEGGWTQTASGVKVAVPAGTTSIAYEVQHVTRGPKSVWTTICSGTLAVRPTTTVNIAIDRQTTCSVSGT